MYHLFLKMDCSWTIKDYFHKVGQKSLNLNNKIRQRISNLYKCLEYNEAKKDLTKEPSIDYPLSPRTIKLV